MGGDVDLIGCFRACKRSDWQSVAGRCGCRVCRRVDKAEKYYASVNRMHRHSCEGWLEYMRAMQNISWKVSLSPDPLRLKAN